MKKYLERYVYAVTKRLPEDQREDVKRDLESNILDMVGENPSDEDLDRVLHELGNPRVVANNYDDTEKTVIHPLFYSDYINALKIVLIIFGSLTVIFTTIDGVLNLGDFTFWQAFGHITGDILSSLISTLLGWFAVITIVFWGLSQIKSRKQILNNWRLKDLPEIPKEEKKTFSLVGTMIEFIIVTTLSLFFIILLIFYVDRFGWYENNQMVVGLFDNDLIRVFIPAFILSFIINTIVYLLKIRNQKYTISIISLYSISKLISMVAVLIMINLTGFINPDFISYAASQSDISLVELTNGLNVFFNVLTIVIIVTNVLDLATQWHKFIKTKKGN